MKPLPGPGDRILLAGLEGLPGNDHRKLGRETGLCFEVDEGLYALDERHTLARSVDVLEALVVDCNVDGERQ
jgi:hypothetical protein